MLPRLWKSLSLNFIRIAVARLSLSIASKPLGPVPLRHLVIELESSNSLVMKYFIPH